MPGLIERIVLSGSDKPERYLKRIEPAKRVQGGYCIQAAPFELSQVISAIRAHAAPRSMLCVGVDSAGTERLLAEELGILSIRFTGESDHPAFEKNGEALQAAGINKAKCETFDLVTVAGDSALADFEAIKGTLRQGTVVVVFDTGLDAMQPECRLLWHKHRNAQNVLLHTHELGTGVFMVKNMTALGLVPEVPVPRKGKEDGVYHDSPAEANQQSQADGAPGVSTPDEKDAAPDVQTASRNGIHASGAAENGGNTPVKPKGKPGRKPKVTA